MIGQVLVDVIGWSWEHPWHLLLGGAVWMLLSVGVALITGPVAARADYEELGAVDR